MISGRTAKVFVLSRWNRGDEITTAKLEAESPESSVMKRRTETAAESCFPLKLKAPFLEKRGSASRI
jgi:hypothetical protein